jgi:[ribosomal protein S5]-alanine N-acetyltransferase
VPRLRTPRLLLIPATPATLTAELASTAALAESLGVDVPSSWPPEYYDDDAIRWTLNVLESGRCPPDWCMYYFTEPARPPERGRLVGIGGYKGAPNVDGAVEIGYSIVPESRRRGYAREAVDGLIGWAFHDPRVRRVIAHTLPGLAPSIGVLDSAGFAYVGPEAEGDEAEAILYALTREVYDASLETRAPFVEE